MPYLTVFLVVSVPLAVEWFFSTTIPQLWHRPRWLVLPVGNALLGWALPMQILGPLPWAEHALSAFLGLALGLLVAILGHFQAMFWTGPTEDDIAATGRRSLYSGGHARRP